MAIGDYDAIDRAARILRDAPEVGWHAIEGRVIAAVRAAARSGWPLDVDDPRPTTVRGALRVSDLVLTTLLNRVLVGDPDYLVSDVSILSEDAALQSISVELSGRYQADLRAASSRVAERCATVVAEVIGTRPEVAVSVIVTDVYD